MLKNTIVLLGYLLGIATGLAISLVYARKQKPWSELSGTERKIRIGLLVIGVGLLVAGVAAMLVT